MGKIQSGSSTVFDGLGIARIGDGIQVSASEVGAALGSSTANPSNTTRNVDGTTTNPFFDANGNLKPEIPGTALIGISGSGENGVSNNYTTLQDFLNLMNSPGLIAGGELTAVGNTVVVAEGTALLRVADDHKSQLNLYDFPESVLPVPNDSLTHYVGLVWNNGSPTVELRSSNDWDDSTEIALGYAVNIGGSVQVLTSPFKTGEAVTNIIHRFDAQAPVIRDAVVGGLMLYEDVAQTMYLSGGKVWSRLGSFTHNSQTTESNPMLTAYWDGSAMVFGANTTWDNLHYNSGGALVDVDVDKYGTLWFFMHAQTGAFGYAYGTSQYGTPQAAALAPMPTYLTPAFRSQTLFIGRLIFKQGAGTATSIDSPFDNVLHAKNVVGGSGGNTIPDTDSLPEGSTNLYFTDARARTATVTQSIVSGNTTHAPSSNAVYNAIQGKADDSNVVHKTGDESVAGVKTFTNGIDVQVANSNFYNVIYSHANGSSVSWANWIEDGSYGGSVGSLYYDIFSGAGIAGAFAVHPQGRLGIGVGYNPINAAVHAVANANVPLIKLEAKSTYSENIVTITRDGVTTFVIDSSGAAYSNGNIMWHAGNDGSGSGLDAGLLEGQNAAYYRNATNLNTGTVAAARLGSGAASNTTFLRGDNVWATLPAADLSYSSNSTAVHIDSAAGTDVDIPSANNTNAGVLTSSDYMKLAAIPAGGAVNLSNSANATHVTINSSTGTGTSVATANSTVAGVITAANQSKLDGIQSGAQVNVPTDLSMAANSISVAINSSTGADIVVAAANSTVAGVMSASDYSRLVNTSGTNTGDQTTITGNAGTATALQTARTIALSGIVVGTATSFNGTANITIPVTSVDLGNANNTGTVATARLGSGTANTITFLRGDNSWGIPATNLSLSSNATHVNVNSDTGTDVSIPTANSTIAGAMTAADYTRLVNTSGTNTGDQTTITGNAGTATALQTARTIALSGIVTGTATSFNGTANITIPVTAVDLGNANNTGTVATARLGSGTANSTTVLYGNNTWAAVVGTTNLSVSSNATHVGILSDTGTDAFVPNANSTIAGITSAADYTRLVNTSGTNTGDQTTITGNAGSATVLQTARTIALSGVATGTATSFNGSANITIPVTSINLGSANNTGIVAVVNGGSGVNTSTGSNNVVLSHSPTFTGTVTLPTVAVSSGLYATVPGVMAHKSGTLSTSAGTIAVLDTYNATYRSAKYIVQVVNTVTGHSEITELLMTVDNSNNVFITEWAINYTGVAALATFSADYSAPNKRLLVTPASADATQFKFSATLFEA